MEPKGNGEEKLTHKPVNGYPTAFYLIFAVALVYLVVIFIKSV